MLCISIIFYQSVSSKINVDKNMLKLGEINIEETNANGFSKLALKYLMKIFAQEMCRRLKSIMETF